MLGFSGDVGAGIYTCSDIAGKLEKVRLQSQKLIRQQFAQMPARIFMPSDLSDLVRKHKSEWNAWGATTAEIVKFLLEESLVTKAEFKSKEYPPIVRYVTGEHSAIQLALSLQRDSFLSHGTAMVVHGMTPPSTTLYVNREQAPKDTPDEVTQAGITRAFANKQRKSKYIFSHSKVKYVLLGGKHTGRAGVISPTSVSGEKIDVTDIERTLIDVVVRPAYTGGIDLVADVYKRFANRIDIDHMINLLQHLQHAYPYHQSIGFLLERAGRSHAECEEFASIGKNFEFYLDYDMKHPVYSPKWRLYYPASLDRPRIKKHSLPKQNLPGTAAHVVR